MNKLKILQIDSKNWKEYESVLKNIYKQSKQDYSKASENMVWEDWENNSKSLMHTLVKQKRYDPPKGIFNIAIKDNTIIYCSGCYESDWSKDVLIMGVRTWTHPEYRKEWWKGNSIIPIQLEFAKKNNYKAVIFTFNEYNLWLAKIMDRTTKNKAIVLGRKNSNIYKDFHLLDKYYLIKNTKQKISVNLLNCTMKEFQQNYLPEEYNVTSMG
jgi:hypothetical protein